MYMQDSVCPDMHLLANRILQVFWASLSLLFSSYVNIYKQGLLLLTACMQQLPMHDNTIQNILLAAAPSADPGKLQQMLNHCHAASILNSSSRDSNFAAGKAQHSMRAPSPNLGAAAASASGRSRYATAPAGRSNAGAAGSKGGGPAGAAQQDVAASFVGGVDWQGGRPMRWPFAQLLPWPERGPDGPAHQMLAVQQVLFKGLLFPQTQLETVHLFTLLAQGLCQLPPGAPQPVQAPAAAGLDAVRSSSASRERDQHQHAGSSGVASLTSSFHSQRASGSGQPAAAAEAAASRSSTSSSRSASRATTGTPPGHRQSRESLGASGAGVRPEGGSVMRSSGGGMFGPGEFSVRAKAARFWQSLQQEQQVPVSPRQQQQQEEEQRQQQRQLGDDGKAAEVSRSAPDLRNLRAQRASGSAASTAEMQAQPPPQQQQQQQQQLLQSSCSMWTPLMRSSSSNAAGAGSTSRRLPGTRAAFQCILGQRHAQLLVSIACIVPFFCSQLGRLEPDSELLLGLQDCVYSLAGACCTHGFGPLGNKLQLFAEALNTNPSGSLGGELQGSSTEGVQAQQQQQRHVHFSPGMAQQPGSRQPGVLGILTQGGGLGGSGGSASGGSATSTFGPHLGQVGSTLLQLMRPLCLQLSRALLPTCADWLLRFWMGLLLLPGAAQLHPHVLMLLRCLFDTPGLQLGSAAGLLLDGSFLSPVVALSQVGRDCAEFSFTLAQALLVVHFLDACACAEHASCVSATESIDLVPCGCAATGEWELAHAYSIQNVRVPLAWLGGTSG